LKIYRLTRVSEVHNPEKLRKSMPQLRADLRRFGCEARNHKTIWGNCVY
jgi:hypothetical protein